MFEPLGTVLVAESWKDTELDTVAAAMKSWDGVGQVDLRMDNVKKFRQRSLAGELKAPSLDKKSKSGGPLRWKTTQAVVGVAALVKARWRDLWSALKINAPAEEVPASHERIAALTEELAMVRASLEVSRTATTRAQDAHRKAAARLKELHLKKKGASKTQVRKELSVWMTKRIQDAKENLKWKFDEQVDAQVSKKTRLAEEEMDSAVTSEQKKTSKARAKARKVEKAARLSRARLVRANRLQKELDAATRTSLTIGPTSPRMPWRYATNTARLVSAWRPCRRGSACGARAQAKGQRCSRPPTTRPSGHSS